MLIYHDWNASPNCLKTKILLNELGIPYEQRDVEAPTLRGPEYRATYPTGLAPSIEDGELKISESAAIALYLAEKHGALIPKTPFLRGLMLQAISIEASLVAPSLGGLGLFGELYKPEGQRNQARIEELQVRAQRIAQILGAVLGARSYFAQDFSIADIQLYAATSKAIEARIFTDPPQNLLAWCERMTARPSVAAARQQYLAYRKQAA